VSTPIEYALVSEARISRLPWQKAGLTYTATGYGARIPTQYMIRVGADKRWRRVYSTCYGNAGSVWINVNGGRRFLYDTDISAALDAGKATR